MTSSFASTLEKIEQSQSFKNFKKQHKDAELCAGFFVIDYASGADQQQLDYCLKNGKIFTFILNQEVQVKEAETLNKEAEEKQKLERLNINNIKIDLDDIERILKEKLNTEKIDKRINKIIAILHKHEGREIWNLNCMLEGMEILQVHINCENGNVMKFERKSMFDFIKKY